MQSEGVHAIHSLPLNTLLYHKMDAVTKTEVVDEEQSFKTLRIESTSLFLLKGMLFVLPVSKKIYQF
jgi:hypothetical protein